MTDEKPADWRPLVALELVDIDGNTVLVPVTGRAEFGTGDSLQAEITVGGVRVLDPASRHLYQRFLHGPRIFTITSEQG